MSKRIVINDLLSVGQAADLLEVSIYTLSSWRVERRGPAYYKIGSRVCYHVDDINDWISSQRREPLGN